MSRNYLEAIVIIIIAGAFGFFLTWPKYGDLSDVIQKIAAKDAEIKNRQAYFAGLEKTAIDLEQYKDDLQKVETALPDGADASALMSFIQSAAIQSGLILKNIDYAKSDKTSSSSPSVAGVKRAPRTYGIASTLTGTYPNIKNFLSRIELSSRMIELDEISFSYDPVKTEEAKNADLSKKNEELSFDFRVSLYAYYY